MEKIDVIGQMILATIPIIVTPLYAFYRIKKFKKGVLVILLTFTATIIDSMITSTLNESDLFMLENWQKPVDLSYQYAAALIIWILLPMYFTRKWTIEYNEKVVVDTKQ